MKYESIIKKVVNDPACRERTLAAIVESSAEEKIKPRGPPT